MSVGVRPEKIRLGENGGENRLDGTVRETAYVGVATQVIVGTAVGDLTVFQQNADSAASIPNVGSSVVLTWAPSATFIVERGEESTQ